MVKSFTAEFQSVMEASRYLNVHPETIKRYCRNGLLSATKFGNAWLISRQVLDEFARSYIPKRGARNICIH